MGSQLALSVHNWGTPIPVPEQGILFDQYRRTQSAHASPVKGWGLGLALVKALADAHGGSVRVESDIERGTIFTVLLPLDFRARSA
jgi:signal transduction histidine kinase